MCGDSTSIDAVEKLMAGRKANMLYGARGKVCWQAIETYGFSKRFHFKHL
jgi:hypothetical protein